MALLEKGGFGSVHRMSHTCYEQFVAAARSKMCFSPCFGVSHMPTVSMFKQNETWSSNTAQSRKKCRRCHGKIRSFFGKHYFRACWGRETLPCPLLLMACFLYFLVLERQMDTLGIEPRAFRMRSGCDTTYTMCPLRYSKFWILFFFPESKSPTHSFSMRPRSILDPICELPDPVA